MDIQINAELEHRIVAKVQSGRYGSPAEVIQEGLDLLEARDASSPASSIPDANSVWKTIVRLGLEVPEEEWSRLPPDLSSNVDHYLYGSPKASE